MGTVRGGGYEEGWVSRLIHNTFFRILWKIGRISQGCLKDIFFFLLIFFGAFYVKPSFFSGHFRLKSFFCSRTTTTTKLLKLRFYFSDFQHKALKIIKVFMKIEWALNIPKRILKKNRRLRDGDNHVTSLLSRSILLFTRERKKESNRERER